MADYQPTEQDKVLLDYAQTAQRRADPWVEFEYFSPAQDKWMTCCGQATSYKTIRRKPRAVTLKYGEKEWELSVPVLRGRCGGERFIWIKTQDDESEEKWLAALREIVAGGENA